MPKISTSKSNKTMIRRKKKTKKKTKKDPRKRLKLPKKNLKLRHLRKLKHFLQLMLLMFSRNVICALAKLLNAEITPKVTNFGLSKSMSEKDPQEKFSQDSKCSYQRSKCLMDFASFSQILKKERLEESPQTVWSSAPQMLHMIKLK